MWGNLADRLGATDINATLEKIGNAVAPRDDDDDDEYEEDYDDVSDDDYDDDEDDNYGPGEIINKVAGASPFRLAGMLTQALDNRHAGIGDSEESENNAYTVDNDVAGNRMLFSAEYARTDNEAVHNVDSNSAEDAIPVKGTKYVQNTLDQANETVQPPGQLPVTNKYQVSDMVPKNTSAQVSAKKIYEDTPANTIPSAADVIENGGLKSKKPEGEQKRSPVDMTTTGAEVHSSRTKPEHSVSLDRVSSANENLGNRNGMISTENNIPVAKKPFELKESRGIPKNLSGVDPTVPVRNRAKNEAEKNKLQNENLRKDKGAPFEGTTNTSQIVDAAKDRKQTKVVFEGGIDVNTKSMSNISKVTSVKSTEKKPGSAPSDGKNSDEGNDLSQKKTPSDVLGSNEDGGGVENIVRGSSTEPNTLIPKTAQSTPLSNDKSRPRMTDNANDKMISTSNEDKSQELLKSEMNCHELQTQLREAKQEIENLRNQVQHDREKARSDREDLIAQFHSKEARLLQATSEENQNQTLLLEQEYSAKIENLESSLLNERKSSQEQQAEYKRLLRESYSNVDEMEKQLKAVVSKHEMEIAQVQQREERALRKVDDRMAQTMAILDERDEQIKKLKKSIKAMESKVNEHQEGEEEAEEELEELHNENDSLRETIEKLEQEKSKLKDQVATLKSGSEDLPKVQMELTMLREERDRERTKNQAVMDSAMSSRTQLETERDNALSELRDSKQQLAATLGDLEISRADYSRILMANENLQSALEAFQDERRAEMEMIDEQRRESEEALKSAHATATSAMKQIHENEMYEIQKASDNAVKNVMHEMELVEGNLEKLKSENNQMRRSLDEAIKRLQTTQEDVIDRDVMKNILLDWCTLNDQAKRHQVLQVMANLLHFSEEEKEKVHLTSKSLDSVRATVVGALAAPLPPSKADVEHLEGSNVREKWINFLMAETDDA